MSTDTSNRDGGYPVTIDDLLTLTVEKEGSDLHLAAGALPSIRISGSMVAQDYPPLKPQDLEGLLLPSLEEYQREHLEKEWELDFSYSVPGVARFRGNIMKQRGSLAAVFRAVPYTLPKLEDLGLPPGVVDLCHQARGLVLVTGPTGSGKSTTLAAMIDYINRHRALNIVTVEDPIEFLHRHHKSSVRQREVGTDTHSFANALRHVLRHDPDVILIGEMRDLESIAIALTAAETGHLVFSTLHTQTAPLTISRIVDVFQDDRRDQVRQQLANTLKGVISQQLLPRAEGKGRVAAVEFMIDSTAIRSLIREGKEHQLYSTIQTSHALGMQTMDQALSRLVTGNIVQREAALEFAVDKSELDRLLKSQAFSSRIRWKE